MAPNDGIGLSAGETERTKETLEEAIAEFFETTETNVAQMVQQGDPPNHNIVDFIKTRLEKLLKEYPRAARSRS